MMHTLTTEDAEDADPLLDPWRSVSSVFSVVKSLCVLAMVLLAAALPAAAQAPRRPDVRFLATPQNVVYAMLDLAQVTASDVVYDLGSGDGRIPITAARQFGARGVGIEIDPKLVRESEANARSAGVEQTVRFVTGDLFDADIRDATVVTLFLMPGINIDLIPKFKAQLRPGTRIVSHHFAMGDRWLPDETRDVNGLEIFLWRVP
jgi:precorrin-6B methylase 2